MNVLNREQQSTTLLLGTFIQMSFFRTATELYEDEHNINSVFPTMQGNHGGVN